MTKTNYKGTLFACYLAYITQALIVNLPPILFGVFKDEFGLSYMMLGGLVVVVFLTQLVVDALAVLFVDKIGYRASAVIAHIFAAVGMIFLTFLPRILPNPYVGLVIASLIYSIGGGLIEVLVSPIVESLPGEAKASAMSLLHSFYSWGQVLVIILSTFALLFVGKNFWYILPLIWAFLPIITLVMFTKVPLMPMSEENEKIPLKKLVTSKVFLLAFFLMICSGASEQAMGQWASIFAEKGLGISKVLGDLLGPCLFAIMMGLSRTYYGIKGQQIDIYKALIFGSIICIFSFVLTALSPIPFVALIGCALCGLGVSLMWPGMLSIMAKSYISGGTAMFALMALGGDLGCSVGPWLTGAVADISNLNFGLLSGLIFPSAMIIGLFMLKSMLSKE